MPNIIEAVDNNDLNLVKEYLLKDAKNANIIYGDSSLLTIAVEKGNINMAKILINYGAKIDFSYGPYHPLSIAAANQDFEMVKTLINLGADINKGYVLLAITESTKNSKIAMLNLCLENNLDIAQNGYRALQIATEKQDVNFVKALLDAKAPTTETSSDQSPLILAIQKKNLQLVELLANETTSNDNYLGMPALIWAAKDNLSDITTILLNSGANINATFNNASALMWAGAKKCQEVATILIQRGSDYIDYLTNCIIDGKFDALEILINAGVDVNSIANNGDSILSYSACLGHDNITQYLIEKGANLDMQNEDGCTALMLAANTKYFATAQMLIKAGASILTQDNYGQNVWHYANDDIEFEYEKEEKEAIMTLLNNKVIAINKASNFLYNHIAKNNPITLDHYSSLKKLKEVNKEDLKINYTNIYGKAADFILTETVLIKGYKAIQDHYLAIKGICKNNILAKQLNPDVTSNITSFLVSKKISDQFAHFNAPYTENTLNDTVTTNGAISTTEETMEITEENILPSLMIDTTISSPLNVLSTYEAASSFEGNEDDGHPFKKQRLMDDLEQVLSGESLPLIEDTA